MVTDLTEGAKKMAKNYYICTIVGDGTYQNPYRPVIADITDPATGFQAFSFTAEYASNPDGSPTHPWGIVIASGKKHGLARNVPGIDPLPVYPLDVKMSAMNAATQADLGARLQARGVNTSFIGAADGFRDVIRGLGRLHRADFDENNFDVSDV